MQNKQEKETYIYGIARLVMVYWVRVREAKKFGEATENGLLWIYCRRRSLHDRYGMYWWSAATTSCIRLE